MLKNNNRSKKDYTYGRKFSFAYLKTFTIQLPLIQVPTHHFPDLKDILDHDPIINAHVIREPVDREEWYGKNQTKGSSWMADQIR